MRLMLTLLLLLPLVVAVSAVVETTHVQAEEGEVSGVAWLTDLDEARKKAKRSGRPLLVVFR